MSRMVDDEPPIKTHPASKEYRENWDRVFGERCECPKRPGTDDVVHKDNCADAIECAIKSYANVVVEPYATFPFAGPPNDKCDVCGVAAGEWCKPDCSECPDPYSTR